jgi:hypothetical protein
MGSPSKLSEASPAFDPMNWHLPPKHGNGPLYKRRKVRSNDDCLKDSLTRLGQLELQLCKVERRLNEIEGVVQSLKPGMEGL